METANCDAPDVVVRFHQSAPTNAANIALAGAVSSLVPGTYTILSADAIVDGGGSWTLPTLRRFLFSISVTGTEVRLTVSKHGLMMLVK